MFLACIILKNASWTLKEFKSTMQFFSNCVLNSYDHACFTLVFNQPEVDTHLTFFHFLSLQYNTELLAPQMSVQAGLEANWGSSG